MEANRRFLTFHDLYVVGIIALIALADRAGSPTLARLLARTAALSAWWLSRHRRRFRVQEVARILAVGERETRRIVRNCFFQFWDGVFSLHCLREPSVNGVVDVRGIEHVRAALAKGNGAILWETHSFGKRVLAKRILHANGLLVTQLHGRDHVEGFHNSKTWLMHNVIHPFFENRERPFVKDLVHLSPGAFSFNRTLLECLKQNGLLCVAADGPQGHKFVSVEFLGSRQKFSTGMISLARLSGAALLPMFCIHERSKKPTLIIEAPIEIECGADRDRGMEEGVGRYMRLLEDYIRRYPEQFRWNRVPGERASGAAAVSTGPGERPMKARP